MSDAALVHHAHVTRTARDRALVTFTEDTTCEMAYRKSWSIKQYVTRAMAHLNLQPAWDMKYSADLRLPVAMEAEPPRPSL